jgi:LysR family transcriptional regulator, low CO2-responsive transcriptional regulator
VHRSTRVTAQRPLVSATLEPTSPAAAETGLRAARPPRPIAVNDGGVPRETHVENVHPLRLRLLLEIDRTGSISAAAKRCAIGQPSASMHLRTLETAVGQRLVVRNGRGSELTAAGTIVASHATRVLAALDSMRWALDAANSAITGELTLAASQMPSLVLIPPVLRDFSAQNPGVTVNVRTLPSEMVFREVARGAAEIGIAGEVACAEPVVCNRVLIDELVGIAPAGLLSSDAGAVSREEFAHHTLLLGPEGSSTRMITERHLARTAYCAARIWAFDSSEAIKRAVADGIGVSFMSRQLVDDEIERGDLIPFRIPGPERMMRPIYAVQPSLAAPSTEAARFTTLLMDAQRTRAPAEPLT